MINKWNTEYYKDEFGVLHQRNVDMISYDTTYVNKYNNYGELSNYISYLRLGYIIGVIKHVPKSILDIGYGNGAFLKVCRNIIPICAGNDVSGYLLTDDDIIMESNINNEYEVVTFFDSLEHFKTLSVINNLNAKYVIISVPNCKNMDDIEWFYNWKHRRFNEHLHHFNLNSITNFMNSKNYKLLNHTFLEDIIRKNKESENILTMCFIKKV